jgi:hypothetical protein
MVEDFDSKQQPRDNAYKSRFIMSVGAQRLEKQLVRVRSPGRMAAMTQFEPQNLSRNWIWQAAP